MFLELGFLMKVSIGSPEKFSTWASQIVATALALPLSYGSIDAGFAARMAAWSRPVCLSVSFSLSVCPSGLLSAASSWLPLRSGN